MKTSKDIKIVIADDHPLFREGIKSVFSNSSESINIVGEAENGEEAYNLVLKLKPEVLILDIEMPLMNGLEAAEKILAEIPHQKIILLTMYKEEDLFNEAITIGVSAYVLKENAVREVIEAVKIVSEGEFYTSPSISSFLFNRVKKNVDFKNGNPGLNRLTTKEKEILKYISTGLTSRDIADKLFLSYKTIENHRTNICKKLSIQGVHSLLKFAIENKQVLN
jgi:DNA-binding NarL/FixJ family response regulator